MARGAFSSLSVVASAMPLGLDDCIVPERYINKLLLESADTTLKLGPIMKSLFVLMTSL